MPRRSGKPRRLVADGRTYLYSLRHHHDVLDDGRSERCRETLTLYPQPAGSGGGALRIVFADGPGRYVPGGFPLGSGDVGYTRGASLNLHEPGAVRSLLDTALARGWQPGGRTVEVDGWSLLEEAAVMRDRGAAPAPPGRAPGAAANPGRAPA
ncbi:hypothetical protein ACFVHB_08835 [Kitasatospora sp. NPDC127111]|uniref:hypothetical protein n=1 Tax=Kitasatospora sp. NPDC127111 TaxID=3345363 RepID=UPI00362FDD69